MDVIPSLELSPRDWLTTDSISDRILINILNGRPTQPATTSSNCILRGIPPLGDHVTMEARQSVTAASFSVR